MGEDWDEELFEAAKEIEAEIDLGVPQAKHRATVSDSKIQLVRLGAHLANAEGPVGSLFCEVERRRGDGRRPGGFRKRRVRPRPDRHLPRRR